MTTPDLPPLPHCPIWTATNNYGVLNEWATNYASVAIEHYKASLKVPPDAELDELIKSLNGYHGDEVTDAAVKAIESLRARNNYLEQELSKCANR